MLVAVFWEGAEKAIWRSVPIFSKRLTVVAAQLQTLQNIGK